jgi:hypothetical protein
LRRHRGRFRKAPSSPDRTPFKPNGGEHAQASSITAPAAVVLFGGSPRKLRSCRLSKELGFPIARPRSLCWAPPTSRESSSIPTLTLAGMPASPHHVAVLTPRPRIARQASPAKLTAIGLSAR